MNPSCSIQTLTNQYYSIILDHHECRSSPSLMRCELGALVRRRGSPGITFCVACLMSLSCSSPSDTVIYMSHRVVYSVAFLWPPSLVSELSKFGRAIGVSQLASHRYGLKRSHWSGFMSKRTSVVHVALEFMDLGSLADLKKRLGGYGVEPVYLSNISAQIMNGLDYLHKRLGWRQWLQAKTPTLSFLSLGTITEPALGCSW